MKKKYSPVPSTTIRILDKKLAFDIFGFEPKYVNCGFLTKTKDENEKEETKYIPINSVKF